MVVTDAINLLISVIIATVMLQLIPIQQYNFENRIYANKYEKSIYNSTSDYSDFVVYDSSDGKMFPVYNYMQLLTSFAVQGRVMPCDYLIFNNHYITKNTARTITQRTITRELKFIEGGTSKDEAKFILMYEDTNDVRPEEADNPIKGLQAVWYQVITEGSDYKFNVNNKEVIVLRRNPRYSFATRHSEPKYVFKYDSEVNK